MKVLAFGFIGPPMGMPPINWLKFGLGNIQKSIINYKFFNMEENKNSVDKNLPALEKKIYKDTSFKNHSRSLSV